jgi:protein-tyrosine phosphatase
VSEKRYVDWNWIVNGQLAQGAYPGQHPGLFNAFDVVVYCAKEAQPRFKAPPGKAIVYCPMDDDIYRPVPDSVHRMLVERANFCAKQASWRKRVLITCVQGKNRSGLLMGMTLLRLYPTWTPEQAVRIIRQYRKLGGGDVALANTMFEQHLLAKGR